MKIIVASLHQKDVISCPQMVNSWNPGYRSVLKQLKIIRKVGGFVKHFFQFIWLSFIWDTGDRDSHIKIVI